jgi:hypothetical protein
MKDLIIIGTHCPDEERKNLLNKCINSLQLCRNKYDILISSHSEIPTYILNNVDYVFYDKNNELITDIKYLNQPWFSPMEGIVISSAYVNKYSTYLSVYRLLILGLGFAKMFNYKKAHYIEYDTIMNDLSELYDNSILLEKYDNIVIKKKPRNFEANIDWTIGNFMSFKVESVNDLFTNYNKEKLLNILLNSDSKTNEKITNDIMKMNNNTIYIKDYDEILKKDIQFALSDKIKKEEMSYWAVPFYNTKDNKVFAIAWNDKDENPINVIFIINNNKIITFNNIKKFEYKLSNIGEINEIENIVVLVNNKVQLNLSLNEKNREVFKNTSYSRHI